MVITPRAKSMFSFLLNKSGEPWIIANFKTTLKYVENHRLAQPFIPG
jgi:hypothetical protein